MSDNEQNGTPGDELTSPTNDGVRKRRRRRRRRSSSSTQQQTATNQQSTTQESAEAAPSASFDVERTEIDDLKAVFATVRSKDMIEARVRTPGTVVELKVDEGTHVEAGQTIALITDPKLALRIKALDAQIKGLESRVTAAKAEYERTAALRKSGTSPQSRLDQAKTDYDLAVTTLSATRAERQVAEQQVTEGDVLAPASGRVLKVPVTEGSVVLPGESIATIAANEYLLRLELPERHARFMKKGDPVRIGPRGLAPTDANITEGRIVQVYPELEGGRVIADAEVSTIGDYFVGERAVVWISAGKRPAIVVPDAAVTTRFGLDLVRLVDDGGKGEEIVVQLGQPAKLPDGSTGIEVLAGLKPGDRIAVPEKAEAAQ